jgi:hypothetical protein
MPNSFSSLRAHSALRARGRCWVVVFILCRSAKNEPRKRGKGFAPAPRAALGGATQAASVLRFAPQGAA